jgi:spermidine/putrescine transport system ATP-binding protein
VAVEERVEPSTTTEGEASAPDVRLESVTKRFDDVVAVDALTLEVPRGSFFALLGPSGCGKTTTLRMIGGFEEPTEGTIYLGDRDVTDLQPYKRNVNTVFQSYALFPHLNVFENVAFGLRRRGVGKTDVRQRVMEMLDLVQLSGMERRKPRQCSGGQQPQVLLLDEPLGALDLKLRKEMQLFIKGLQQEVGITFIHVTHDQEEAMTMADSIAVMSGGHIEQLGSPDDLYERPATPFVAQFLGVSNLLEGVSNGDGSVRLDDGTVIRAPAASGRQGPVAVGIRPEKIKLGRSDENALTGEVKERAYIGVSTQYIVETPHGSITVYVQNSDAGAAAVRPGDQVTLSWSPDSTFVVDSEKERSE